MQTIKLPQYYCLGLIGRGQFGQVFCAYDYLQQELVAIKVIELKRFSTQQFLRELRFLVTLNHPQIVSCQGIKHYQSQRYLIMDYCEGGSLRDLITKGELKLYESLQIVRDILSGLVHAHSRGIVHCDLKPENILLCLIPQGWSAKISDFGIAKAVEENYYSVSMGDTGSPAYMAPERFYGKFSTASDLYAVGVILYELILGNRPFTGTPKELIAAHLNQIPVIPDQVPFFLRSLILKALEKLPQHRFINTQAMLDSLNNALEIVQATRLQTQTIINKYLNINAELLSTLNHNLISIYSYNNLLYLASYQTIITPNQEEINLKETIINLTTGYLVWCQQDNHYLIYQIKDNQVQFLLNIQASSLIKTVESQGKWLAIAYDLANPELMLFKLDQGILWQKPLTRLPTQVLSLDTDHGLALFREKDQSTTFSFFNRRGNWYEGYSLAIPCEDLVTHPSYPYLLLGREGDKGLLINLKPLRVSRFNLEFIPDFVIPQDWGYLLANREGMIVGIDREGETKARYQLSLGTINTMISINPGEILLGINNYLYKILISPQ